MDNLLKDIIPGQQFIDAMWPVLLFMSFIIIYWAPFLFSSGKTSKKRKK